MLEGTDGGVFARLLHDGAPEIAAGGLRGDDVDDCVPEALSLGLGRRDAASQHVISLSALVCNKYR